MAPTGKSFQGQTTAPEKISILLVTPHSEDLTSLRNILHHRDWVLNHCSTIREASERIAKEPCSIVVTERQLSDGLWKDVLNAADSQIQPPVVLVTSRHADEQLWAEVLNLGGYDLILKPFDRSEVTRIIGAAWRSWFGALRRTAASSSGKFASQVA